MKNILLKFLILILIITSSFNIFAQSINSQNGNWFPPYGTIRIFVVFAEVINIPPNVDSIQGNWTYNTLPANRDLILDTVFTNANAIKGELTKYFYESSFGKLIFLGDYYPNLVKIDYQAALANSDFCVYDYLNNLPGDNIFSQNGYSINSNDFDMWTPQGYYNQHLNNSDGYIDFFVTIWRNFTRAGGGDVTTYNITRNLKNKLGINSITKMNISDFVRMGIRHEFAHPLLGGNNFHSGVAGAGNGTYLSDFGGYSLIESMNSNLYSVNGWDRDRLGWKPDNNQYYISARNLDYSEANADLIYSSNIQNREFILRDFAKYGDAIRIKLPHIKSINNDTRNQYIWIENHQLLPDCIESPQNNNKAKGIRMNIQVGNDNYTSFYDSRTNYISPICSFGNYDFTYSGIDINSKMADFGITSSDKSNPLTGYSLLQAHAVDFMDNNDIILNKEVLLPKKIKKNNQVVISDYNNQEMLYPLFDGYQFDVFPVGSKIGVSTNPSSATNLTFYTHYRNPGASSGYYPNPANDDNRFIFLNGLEIEILEEKPNGDIRIRISCNKFDIENDVRWCGPIILTEEINIKENKTVIIDQGLSPTRPSNPQLFQSEKIFADPTVFTAKPQSVINLEETSNLIVKNNSVLVLEDQSNLNIPNNAKVIIEQGSTLLFKQGSNLNVFGNGNVVVESGGYICIEEGSNINLTDGNSIIYMKDGAILGVNSNVISNTNCLVSLNDISINGCGAIINFTETETTANEIWNSTKKIANDYTIKTGHTLTIQNTDISFAPDIKIKVEPGAKLIIDNSTLTSYCSGQYWGGIEVQGQSHLPQTDVYQGYLEIKNSSIIQNAKNAITTWRSGDWNSMGGIVNVLGSTFKNNIKSIEFLSYKNMNQNNQEIDNVSSISKCNFIWDGNMYPHHKTSLNHVSLWDVRGVKFNGCIFSNEELKDEIVQNGIYAEDAGFKVLEAFTPPPVAILKGEFNKLSYGIRVENSNKPIIIRNTTFNNNFCGIFGVATNNMEIIKNDFDVLSVYNLRGQYPVETSYGIAIDNSTGYKIEENVFNGEVNKGVINTGLQVKNSGKNANNIRNNNFNNLYYSTIAIGENRGVNRLGEMVGLKYTCNDFRENKYGIIVKRDANIVQRSYGINLNQDGGDLSLSAENFFDRKDDEIDSDIWIEDNTNQYNYVCFLDNSSKEPLSISDNVVKYNATYSGNCSSNYDLLGNLELDALYLNLENQYLTSLYNYNNLLDGGSTDVLLDKLLDSWEGDIWDLRQSYLAESPYLSPEVLIELALSEKLPLPIYLEIALSNPEATQKDEYIEFMEKPETITLLTVSGIDLIKGSWNNRTFRATMESNISSKLTSMEDVSRTKISRIINDTNGYNITNYRNEINKIRNIEAKYELVESYIETSDYILARNILNSLLEDPVYSKYNEEGINDYLLLLEILEDKDSITNQIIIDNRLIDLSQLPSRAGAKARAYLNFYDDNTNYHPELIAEPSNKSKSIRVKPNISNMFDANIKLSPNPAKDYITFTYDLPPKNIYTVSIYDSKGKEVIVKKLNSNKGVQSIELKNLSSGAYYYTIKDNNKVIKTDKIIVVK